MKLLPLNFSDPKRVGTARGPRDLRVADPDQTFWALWKTRKEDLKRAGYSVTKRNGSFQVCHWETPSEDNVPPKMREQANKARFEQSRATDSKLEIPLSEEAKARGFDYFGFQKAGVERIVANSKKPAEQDGTLLGDDMGVGKTIQQLGAVNYLGAETVLIVCPASMLLPWAQEAFVWLYDTTLPIYVVTSQNAKLDEERFQGINDRVTVTKEFPKGDRKVVIINYDILHKYEEELRERVWDYVGFDESHYAKNKQSRRTKHCFGGRV